LNEVEPRNTLCKSPRPRVPSTIPLQPWSLAAWTMVSAGLPKTISNS